MPVSDGFKEFVRDLLADFGPITIRNMFGGAGVYAGGVMFAILANDTFYLKADETSARAFADEGMQPFSYRPEAREPITMFYWEVPPRLFDEPEELVSWAHEAHCIACVTKRKPPRRQRR